MIYSNCLLEALKAKLKDWEGVTLHKIPARFTGAVFPHFWWSTETAAFDFKSLKKNRRCQVILFKGSVHEYDLITYKNYVTCKLTSYVEKLKEKYGELEIDGAAAYWKSAYESLRWNDLKSEQPEKDSCISIAYRNKNGMPVIQCINSMEIGKYPETQYWRYEELLKENMQIDFEELQERGGYEKVE